MIELVGTGHKRIDEETNPGADVHVAKTKDKQVQIEVTGNKQVQVEETEDKQVHIGGTDDKQVDIEETEDKQVHIEETDDKQVPEDNIEQTDTSEPGNTKDRNDANSECKVKSSTEEKPSECEEGKDTVSKI